MADNAFEIEIIETLSNVQTDINRMLRNIGNATGLSEAEIALSVLYTDGNPHENKPWVQDIRSLKSLGFSNLARKLLELYQAGALENLPTLAHENKEPSRGEGKKLDLHNALVNGLTLWLIPMSPGTALALHNHKANIGSLIMSGAVREMVFTEHGGEVLECISDTTRLGGDINILDPGGANIHTLINESETKALTMHITGFSPNNLICPMQHPLRELFQVDDKDVTNTKADRAGAWSIEFTEQSLVTPWAGRVFEREQIAADKGH